MSETNEAATPAKGSKGRGRKSVVVETEVKKPVIWEYTKNADAAVATYLPDLGKEMATKGGFQADYGAYAKAYGISPCPYFTTFNTSLRIINTSIDLSSWRAALLACATTGASINQIHVYNSKITPQHILDLVAFVEKINGLEALKLECLIIEQSPQLSQAVGSLLAGSASIDYISLRGNGFDDEFIESIAPSLCENLNLKALNLAANRISNDGFQAILRSLRKNICLQELSVAGNNITTGECLQDLASLFCGCNSTPEYDALVKSLTKTIGDRNKQIKEANKKRKKAGQAELPELPSPPEVLLKIDGQMWYFNRTLTLVDLTANAISAEKLNLFLSTINSRLPALSALGSPRWTLRLRGMFDGIPMDTCSALNIE